jgi:hypothetical protein
MYIKGYLFETLSFAQEAVTAINKGEGIPISKNSTTTSYCEPVKCKNGYYLSFDNVTAKYLNKPKEINQLM